MIFYNQYTVLFSFSIFVSPLSNSVGWLEFLAYRRMAQKIL